MKTKSAWVGHIDPVTNKAFFVNANTNEKSWNPPIFQKMQEREIASAPPIHRQAPVHSVHAVALTEKEEMMALEEEVKAEMIRDQRKQEIRARLSGQGVPPAPAAVPSAPAAVPSAPAAVPPAPAEVPAESNQLY